MEAHECLKHHDVIVETVGKVQGTTHALERRRESLPEAFRPGEVNADARLRRRTRRCFAQRLRKNRDGEVVVLELGEENEGLGARGPALRLGQKLVPDRPGARRSPAARWARAAASPRRLRSSRVSGEVRRSAWSASSAAKADAPRSAARRAASSSTAATPVSSPSSTSVAGSRLAWARKAWRELSSSSLPTISIAILP